MLIFPGNGFIEPALLHTTLVTLCCSFHTPNGRIRVIVVTLRVSSQEGAACAPNCISAWPRFVASIPAFPLTKALALPCYCFPTRWMSFGALACLA